MSARIAPFTRPAAREIAREAVETASNALSLRHRPRRNRKSEW